MAALICHSLHRRALRGNLPDIEANRRRKDFSAEILTGNVTPLTPAHNGRMPHRSGGTTRSYLVPGGLRELAGGGETCEDAEALRAVMVRAGWCKADAPAVTLELYGTLRLKSGCEVLPMRASRLADVASLLLRAFPELQRLIPDEATLRSHYRFSLNGERVTTDPGDYLTSGDHVLLFSASVGG